MVFDIFLTLFLVFLNGFFVAAEFAIVKVRSSQIELGGKPGMGKRIAKKILAKLDAYLAATQLGITLASLGLGWIGEEVVSELLLTAFAGVGLSEATAHSLSLPTAFATITILHIIFGELAPKSLAIRHPAETTFKVAFLLRIFYFIFSPFIWLLNGLANFILKLVGIKPLEEGEIHTEEELRMIIAESAEGGAIRASERELIHNVFEFDNRLVKQVMLPQNHVTGINLQNDIPSQMENVQSEKYSRVPVYESNLNHIKGVLFMKDLVGLPLPDKESLENLLRPALIVGEDVRVVELLRRMQREKNHMYIVVDEHGGTSGIVTMEDVMEEIVGEIFDEFDEHDHPVKKESNSRFKIIAQARIAEINKFLPEPIPFQSPGISLSGLVVKTIGRFPHPGDTFQLGPYEGEVLKVTENTVREVRLNLISEPSDKGEQSIPD